MNNWPENIFNVNAGDVIIIAGRQFRVDSHEGRGWDMVITLIATRLFMSKTGPTNMLRCTLRELMNKVITIHRRIDRTV